MKNNNGSSNRIADILRVIDEIGFQTSVLALTAAVDAARAIEAGLEIAGGEASQPASHSAADGDDGAAVKETLAAHARDLYGIVERIRAMALDRGQTLPAAAAGQNTGAIEHSPPSTAAIAALANSLQSAGTTAPTPDLVPVLLKSALPGSSGPAPS